MIYNRVLPSFFCITAKNLQKSLSFLVLCIFVSISYSDNAKFLGEGKIVKTVLHNRGAQILGARSPFRLIMCVGA